MHPATPTHETTAPPPASRGFGTIALIALLSAFIPLSTDLYLPALPTMAATLRTTPALVNLTLVAFFVCYSLGTLFWGPMSDRYGRRPIMHIGLVMYVLASVGCAVSEHVDHLIAFRALQALGGGAATATATAIVKDLYAGRRRESVLALVQTIAMLAPIVAPVPGALLLQFTSWRGVFVVLAAVGAGALLLSLPLRETLPARFDGTVLQTLGRLGVVLRNPGFASLLVIFSLVSLPFLAYISSSSYIYQDEFGVSKLQFGLFFMGNALSALASPMLYLLLSRRVSRQSIITGCFAIMAASGVLIITVGHLHPWAFMLVLIPATMAVGVMRPPGANLMLEQQDTDTGSAVSLIGCFGLLFGCLGMLLISLFPGHYLTALGLFYIAGGLLCGLGWLAVKDRPFIRHLPDVHPDDVRAAELSATAAE